MHRTEAPAHSKAAFPGRERRPMGRGPAGGNRPSAGGRPRLAPCGRLRHASHRSPWPQQGRLPQQEKAAHGPRPGRRKPPSSAGGLLPCAFGGHPGTIGLFRVGHGEGGSIALKGSCCRKRIPALSAAWAEALTSAWQTADGRAGLRGLRARGLSGRADGGPAEPLLPVPRQGGLRRYEAHPEAGHGHEPLSGPAEMLRFAALDPAVLAAP